MERHWYVVVTAGLLLTAVANAESSGRNTGPVRVLRDADGKILLIGRSVDPTTDQLRTFFRMIKGQEPTENDLRKAEAFFREHPLPPPSRPKMRVVAVDRFFEQVFERDPTPGEIEQTLRFVEREEVLRTARDQLIGAIPKSELDKLSRAGLDGLNGAAGSDGGGDDTDAGSGEGGSSGGGAAGGASAGSGSEAGSGGSRAVHGAPVDETSGAKPAEPSSASGGETAPSGGSGVTGLTGLTPMDIAREVIEDRVRAGEIPREAVGDILAQLGPMLNEPPKTVNDALPPVPAVTESGKSPERKQFTKEPAVSSLPTVPATVPLASGALAPPSADRVDPSEAPAATSKPAGEEAELLTMTPVLSKALAKAASQTPKLGDYTAGMGLSGTTVEPVAFSELASKAATSSGAVGKAVPKAKQAETQTMRSWISRLITRFIAKRRGEASSETTSDVSPRLPASGIPVEMTSSGVLRPTPEATLFLGAAAAELPVRWDALDYAFAVALLLALGRIGMILWYRYRGLPEPSFAPLAFLRRRSTTKE